MITLASILATSSIPDLTFLYDWFLPIFILIGVLYIIAAIRNFIDRMKEKEQ